MSFILLKAPQQEKYKAQIAIYVVSTPKQCLCWLMDLWAGVTLQAKQM